MSLRIARSTVRQLSSQLLAITAMISFLIAGLSSCEPFHSPWSAEADVATGFPPRTYGYDRCKAWADGNWHDSGAGMTLVVGDDEPRGICGFVVRHGSNPLTYRVSLRVPCGVVGNITNPSPGQCNNGYDNMNNNKVAWTDLVNPRYAYLPDTTWGFVFELDPYTSQHFTASIPRYNVIGDTTSAGDFFVKALVRFQYLGQNPATDPAEAYYKLLGEIERQTKGHSGPSTVEVGQAATWQVTAGSYNLLLYRFQWYLDGTLQTGATNSYFSAGQTSGTHHYKALVTLHDLTVDTVTFDVATVMHAGVSGTSNITEAGSYTWDAEETGVSGVSYSWWKVDDGTSATTYLGSGSSASVTLDASSASFNISVMQSSSGWPSASAIRHVHVNIGGLEQLKAPVARTAPKRAAPPKR